MLTKKSDNFLQIFLKRKCCSTLDLVISYVGEERNLYHPSMSAYSAFVFAIARAENISKEPQGELVGN